MIRHEQRCYLKQTLFLHLVVQTGVEPITPAHHSLSLCTINGSLFLPVIGLKPCSAGFILILRTLYQKPAYSHEPAGKTLLNPKIINN
jgi:hypothetical protein